MTAGGDTVHATAVAIDGRAVLIFGAPGRGKSDLALRLIDRGAVLISDDYVELFAGDGGLRCRRVPTIAGHMEVRGVGIVRMAFIEDAPVALAVDLDSAPARLPAGDVRTIGGVRIPAIAVDAFQASAPIKVELALSGKVLPLD